MCRSTLGQESAEHLWIKIIRQTNVCCCSGYLFPVYKLTMSQQFTLVAKKANRLLGCNRQLPAIRLREVTLSLCLPLVRPHMESWVQCWALQNKRDINILKGDQYRYDLGTAASLLWQMSERAVTVQPEERICRGHLIIAYKHPMRENEENWATLFSEVFTESTKLKIRNSIRTQENTFFLISFLW